jgi:hypothetical protein
MWNGGSGYEGWLERRKREVWKEVWSEVRPRQRMGALARVDRASTR